MILCSMGNQDDFDDSIVEDLKNQLNLTNSYVQSWRMARDNLRHADSVDFQLRLINKRSHDGRTHNLPSALKLK